MEMQSIMRIVKAEIASDIELVRTRVQSLTQNCAGDATRNVGAHSIRVRFYVSQIIISRYYDTPYW